MVGFLDHFTSGSSERGSSYCADCAAGKEFNPATKLCEACPEGSTSAAGAAAKAHAHARAALARGSAPPCPGPRP